MRPFRVLHVSNMNIDNPTAPAVDPSFLEELSLWAPDVVVLTGDLVESGARAGAPEHYDEVLACFRRLERPLVVLCGNHDPSDRFERKSFYERVGPLGLVAAHNWIRVPLSENAGEKKAFLKALGDAARDGPDATLLLCHENAYALDAVFAEAGELLKKARAGLLISGSHRERETNSRVPLRLPRSGVPYLCTHEGSTTRRARATGVPHYRVLDLVGERPPERCRHRTVLGGFACVYDAEEPLGPGPGLTLMRSIPAGKLSAIRSEDGSALFVRNSLDVAVLGARAFLDSPGGGAVATGGRVISEKASGEKTVCEVEFDLPPRAWKTVGLFANEPPYEVEIEAPETLVFGEPREITVVVTNARDEDAKDVFALSLGGDYARRSVELAPRETKRLTFQFRPRGRRARMDAAVLYSTRERLTWERWVELVPPAELKSAEWVVEPGDGMKLSLSLELVPRVNDARLKVLLDGGRRGTAALKDGQNAVELGALEPGSGDDLARVWFAWKEGAELLALLPLRVARADGGWHALVENVTGEAADTPARFCVTKEGDALVLEVSVAEPWPDGAVTGARADVPAEERPPLWKDDGVEWFLADSERRVHLLANRAGMFDVESDEATKGLLEDGAKLDSREDAWRIELPDIFAPGVLRMNVVRNRVVEGATECHAWSPTRGDSHEKEYWGHLVR